ncbi:hypothetical protein ACLESO_49795 [Pyxidicoccus sp. 3LG]
MSRSSPSLVMVLALVLLCACDSEPPCPEGYVPPEVSCNREVREGDDHGDTLAAATPMTTAALVDGRLDVDTDEDLFSFRATADRIYRVSCGGAPEGDSPRFSVALLATSGAALAGAQWSALSSGGAHASVLAPQDGILFVRVKSQRVDPYVPFVPFDYRCSLSDLGADDHADTLAEATVVHPGPSISAHHELIGDVDVFAIDAVAGYSYRLRCLNHMSLCGLRLRSPGGQELRTHMDMSSSTIEFVVVESGRYTVEVFSQASFTSHGFGGYTFDIGGEVR